MKKIRCAALFAALGMGLMAGGCGPTLLCGNPLDGSMYGFNLVVPDGYECGGSFPATSPILGLVAYKNEQDQANRKAILVIVVAAQTDGGDGTLPQQEGVTFSEEMEYESAEGLTFVYRKGTSTDPDNEAVSYIGAIDLPDGENALGLYLDSQKDSNEVLQEFEALLEGLTFTN